MERVTVRDLEAVVARINRTVNGTDEFAVWESNPGWSVETGTAKNAVRQVPDVYHLDGAYGGYALFRNCSVDDTGESHGVHDVLGGHLSKRELYERMQAFLRGVEVAAA